jgi:YVTN family beta-propeller protein
MAGGKSMEKRGNSIGVAVILVLFFLTVGSLQVAAEGGSPTGDGRPDYTRRTRHAVPEDDLYKSPLQLLLDSSGRRLFVACEGTDELLVVDTRKQRVVNRVLVGEEPFAMLLNGDESRLYVGNRFDNDVAVVDLKKMEVEHRFPVGDDPHEMVFSADERYLFVTNLSTNDLSVIDLESESEVKRLSMGTAPFGAALSPDGRSLYISNQYSIPVPFRTPSILELTIVDVESQFVRERRDLYSTVIGQGVAASPDGHFVATALELPKNLIPETQVYQGWMVTYGFALTETRKRGRTAYMLIDEPNLYFADPYGITFTPDGRYLYISSSGVDQVTVVDMEKVYQVLEVEDGRIGISDEQIERYARHLALSNEYVVARIPTGSNPKGLVISADGKRGYVANRLDDNITVIDVETQKGIGRIDLGGPEAETTLRYGAKLFNFASISLHKQMSCNTCHPENSVDGLVYDIAVDGGMGRNLVDNLTMRGLAETAPFKWTGKNPNLQRQEGPRAAQLFFRTHGFQGAENQAIVRFIESIPPRPNRYREEEGKLNEFQESGKMMFERAYDNMGRYIPVANRCITCHPQPYGTDRKVHDIASKGYHDWDGNFDTPHLINVFERAPYMHDGRCYSLEEIWTEFNMDDTHGVTNDMMKEHLNALVEYMKTF